MTGTSLSFKKHQNHPLFKFTKKVGSPRYMSPEIALGEYYNELSDIYSLGLLSYEILSLNKPYDTNNDIVVVDDCTTTTYTTTQEVDNDNGNGNGNGSSMMKSKSYKSRRHIRRNRNNKGNNSNDNDKKQQQQQDDENNNSKNKNMNMNMSKNMNMKKDDYKYLNVRPLLPIMTPHEEQQQQQQQQQDVTASSLYWTKSLRYIILQSWDRNIQNRPTAIEIQKQFQIEYDKLNIKTC